jgi:hypothetical protein
MKDQKVFLGSLGEYGLQFRVERFWWPINQICREDCRNHTILLNIFLTLFDVKKHNIIEMVHMLGAQPLSLQERDNCRAKKERRVKHIVKEKWINTSNKENISNAILISIFMILNYLRRSHHEAQH